jgi:hypothetical protein
VITCVCYSGWRVHGRPIRFAHHRLHSCVKQIRRASATNATGQPFPRMTGPTLSQRQRCRAALTIATSPVRTA